MRYPSVLFVKSVNFEMVTPAVVRIIPMKWAPFASNGLGWLLRAPPVPGYHAVGIESASCRGYGDFSLLECASLSTQQAHP